MFEWRIWFVKDYIEIKGARIHNLNHVNVKIPRNKLTVITGVSGSGKSSLAFDTIYEEGKRRYLLFSGTQFMVDSVPCFDEITGLSPTVAVEQRIIRQSNPRSTVGTRTKITNLLAALFAVCGKIQEEYDDGEPSTLESFLRNSPAGMCPRCLGKGNQRIVDEEAIYGDESLPIQEVLEKKFMYIGSWKHRIQDYYKHLNVTPEQSIGSLNEEQLFALKYGSPKTTFSGVNSFAPTEVYEVSESMSSRQKSFAFTRPYASIVPCDFCNGTGLGLKASHTYICEKNMLELERMYIKDLLEFLLQLGTKNDTPLLKEILSKLQCMVDVGLHHLALSRPVPTLSGGEIQRLFLASYIIAEMDSIIFIFDEPTIGLHEVEKNQLITIIKNLVERGNTVIAVEHDKNFMMQADYMIDMGPDAGYRGGEKIFEGTYDEFLLCKESRTAPYLMGTGSYMQKQNFKPLDETKFLTLKHASLHNLRDVSVELPLGLLVGIAGVSGSGKSSLITDTLVPKLKEVLKNDCVMDEESEEESDARSSLADCNVAESSDTNFVEECYEEDFSSSRNDLKNSSDYRKAVTIEGSELIKKCVVIDQKPIGRSRTSCPATYTGIMDKLRNLFASTERAKELGYGKGMFSVNSKGGCRKCHGDGTLHYYVGFGNFIDVQCDQCDGIGFLPEVMEVLLEGKTMKDVLELTVDEAAEFFVGMHAGIERILETLQRVGMGYMKLGQKTPTISGGESQRIKLATELSKYSRLKGQKNFVYILDEPTTGLSYHDSSKLLELMQELVDQGNTVIVTEHDPYILSNCDYIIELGPGGGSDGGTIIAKGSPEQLKKSTDSVIGSYLM